MSVPVALFIPVLGGLLIGLDWDMGISEDAKHDNKISNMPIEDPTRSFIMDYNRVQPTELTAVLQVSANPTLLDFGPVGAARITLLYENLLSIKARQSVEPGAFFDVFTGVKLHRNMAIQSIGMKRESDTANEAVFTIKLMEFRFAKSPRQTEKSYLMEANEGPTSSGGQPLVDAADRPIVEATKNRSFPRLGRPTLSQNALIGAGLSAGGANITRILG